MTTISIVSSVVVTLALIAACLWGLIALGKLIGHQLKAQISSVRTGLIWLIRKMSILGQFMHKRGGVFVGTFRKTVVVYFEQRNAWKKSETHICSESTTTEIDESVYRIPACIRNNSLLKDFQ